MGLRDVLRPRHLLIALALLGAASLAHAQYVPYFGKNQVRYDTFSWRVYKSPHFEVFYYPEFEQHLARVASYLESAYQKVSSDLKHEVNFAIPVILYNIPSRTGVNVTAETMLRLAHVPNIIGVKEASGDLKQISRVIEDAPDYFHVWSGDDEMTLPILAVGGYGVIAVASHLAGTQMRDMIEAHFNGDPEVAQDRLGSSLSFCFRGLAEI